MIIKKDNKNEDYSHFGWATSPDGIHWNKHNDTTTTSALYADSDPILKSSSGQWDELFVAQGTVMHEGDSLRMWYSGSRSPTLMNLVRIGHASRQAGKGAKNNEGVNRAGRPSK